MPMQLRFVGSVLFFAIAATLMAGCAQRNSNALGKQAEFSAKAPDGIVIFGMRKTRQAAILELSGIDFRYDFSQVDLKTHRLSKDRAKNAYIVDSVGADEVNKTKFFVIRLPAGRFVLSRRLIRIPPPRNIIGAPALWHVTARPALGIVVEPGTVNYIGDFTVEADSRPNWVRRVRAEWSGFNDNEAQAALAKYERVSAKLRRIRMTPVRIKSIPTNESD